MKKIAVLTALLLVACMVTGCGSNAEELGTSEAETTAASSAEEHPSEETNEETTEPEEASSAVESTKTEDETAETKGESTEADSSETKAESSASKSESSATKNDSSSKTESSAQMTTEAPKPTDPPQEDTPKTPVLENKTGFTDLMSFSADGLDNTTWSEADFAKADVTVINLWATFCGPCIEEMPEIAAFQKKLPSNVQLLTCCVDIYGTDGRMDAERILSDAGYTGTTLMNPTGDLQSLVNQMMYVPTTIFVDSEGHLLGEAIIGGGNVEANYTERINEALRAMGKDTI